MQVEALLLVEEIISEIKITSDIKLVFNSSTITMMHGPINIRFNAGTLAGIKNSDVVFFVIIASSPIVHMLLCILRYSLIVQQTILDWNAG